MVTYKKTCHCGKGIFSVYIVLMKHFCNSKNEPFQPKIENKAFYRDDFN